MKSKFIAGQDGRTLSVVLDKGEEAAIDRETGMSLIDPGPDSR